MTIYFLKQTILTSIPVNAVILTPEAEGSLCGSTPQHDGLQAGSHYINGWAVINL